MTSGLCLYKLNDELERHLCKRTNELFDLNDKMILYDLTNTYFESAVRSSKIAKLDEARKSDQMPVCWCWPLR